MEKRSTLIHEILHHFYMNEGREELFKKRFREYLNDPSLDEKEDKFRKILVEELGLWKEHYKPATEEKWFEQMSNEAHSVIGEWLYQKYKSGAFFVRSEWEWLEGNELKLPSYLLATYNNILKEEIINQGR